ncbi:MAG: hypothetical protein UY48_C0030G0002 [Candidatus Gottesmanbacteria bacterium GW2011_GWB1_49_7]|uniref:Uncharacterized protein n=1 Tax=Candidatus Gottesmanbacteria bacterium GW2011_GWB1_49_7 TaxID=1618448 RepID=A0A0G1VWT9_9BACT|nr:MAG: hypothetical protein UY48_C0030G0002 [Candidatus Gottesmanbacteria bacterium GW2011_GWB1_49_7]
MPVPENYTVRLFNAVGQPQTNLASNAHDIGAYINVGVQTVGTLAGADSLQLQQSNDGITWVSLGAAITAAGIREDQGFCRFIRGSLTLDTSASCTVWLSAKPA